MTGEQIRRMKLSNGEKHPSVLLCPFWRDEVDFYPNSLLHRYLYILFSVFIKFCPAPPRQMTSVLPATPGMRHSYPRRHRKPHWVQQHVISRLCQSSLLITSQKGYGGSGHGGGCREQNLCTTMLDPPCEWGSLLWSSQERKNPNQETIWMESACFPWAFLGFLPVLSFLPHNDMLVH